MVNPFSENLTFVCLNDENYDNFIMETNQVSLLLVFLRKQHTLDTIADLDYSPTAETWFPWILFLLFGSFSQSNHIAYLLSSTHLNI